jgi:predicted acetylornithine/succinylornithine family transaminase
VTHNEEWARRAETALLRNYAPAPVAFVRGHGTRLWDADGREYLDFCAGVAVCSTGHAHPRVAEAVAEQAQQLWHVSNLFLIPQQIELAERLAALTGLDGGAFFCNSGTEAVEAALKLARSWGKAHGGRARFVATEGAFHGRTMGALSVTGQAKYRTPFEPLVPGVTHVPFGDAEAAAAAITRETAAVVVEPVQGEGGVNVPAPDYLKALRDACDERDALLVLDEVQTGIGRTGAWFAFQHAGVEPDVVCLAKGLGSGFPIGAIVASERAAAFEPGQHAATFGGNPLACTAALATLDVIEDEGLVANARDRGVQLLNGLRGLGAEHAADPRGLGLLVAFGTPDGSPGAAAMARLREHGLLVSTVGASGIRLAPPLTVSEPDVRRAVDVVAMALSTTAAEAPVGS